MSQRKAEKTKGKSGRNKLSLSKETLKDLTAKDARVKGGVAWSRNADCSF